MCGLCLEQGFVFSFVTEGFDAIEKADTEFPYYWYEFCDDWDVIVERFKKQPDSALDNRVLWARLFVTSFDAPLSARQLALWRHLSEELATSLPEYPTLSFHLNEASQFPEGIAAYISQDLPDSLELLAEANALLVRHLLHSNVCVNMYNCLESQGNKETVSNYFGKNERVFFNACWQEFRHRLFACALLLNGSSDSTTLKRFALSVPCFVAGDFFAFEYRLQRWVLQLIYLEKGVAFLAENARFLLPEHLLYLLNQYSSNVEDIMAVSQAYFDALSHPHAVHPPHYGKQAIREAFNTLLQLASNRHGAGIGTVDLGILKSSTEA
ncbi:hypothetical protein ACLKZ7_02400 [Shewanella algae]|uniref:hypothetical protein n=1 Tax=Shewanella algae TaxID=38313 RepID=UPI001AAC6D81|nr:hypothetical protein [Shewanella algae]MBO2552358.1 hypothetical protein [Shewanella algae]